MFDLVPFLTLGFLFGNKHGETNQHNKRNDCDFLGTGVGLVPIKVISWEEFLKSHE
jgi:hypothetical protein